MPDRVMRHRPKPGGSVRPNTPAPPPVKLLHPIVPEITPAEWQWFITPAAVRQLLAIGGLPDTEEQFQVARKFLGEQSIVARQVGDDLKTGLVSLYRTNGSVSFGRVKTRLEFTVSMMPGEGKLPQLVRVRDKK